LEEADNRPLRSYKGDSFEGGVRVPGIAVWQGMIKPGTSSSELVYVADWYATFAEIAGMNTEGEGKDGVSVLDVLMGGKGERDHVPIISAARHAYISQDFSLLGSGENYQRILNQDFSGFRLYDLNMDPSQQEPTKQHPDLEEEMKAQLKAHFRKTNRGNFNWDIRYAKYRQKASTSDHDLDQVIDDSPEIHVTAKGPSAGISISPVSDELIYTLESTFDGINWAELATYICRKDAEVYAFAGVNYDKKVRDYRVSTRYHYGLPLHDPFSLEDPYQSGPLAELPALEGFLPVSDVKGGEQVVILENSLAFGQTPQEGGALQLTFKENNPEPSFTRYFIQPMARGKVYASMLLDFEGRHEESVGEISWLVQNGWNGATEKQVSLQFQQDGIYIDKADPVPPYTRTWLSEHHRQVVQVLFEFDLGPIGQDILKVYINPLDHENLPEPNATLKGEFTFDRLQFKLTARAPSTLIADEIKIGRELSDVLKEEK
jgi:hypothetical protein